jgi:hypothetical protein
LNIEQTYDEGIKALFHSHIIAFLEVAEVDFIVFFLKVVIRQLIETGRHDCGEVGRKSVEDRTLLTMIRPVTSMSRFESEGVAIESA